MTINSILYWVFCGNLLPVKSSVFGNEIKMSSQLNPAYEAIGKGFVQQYYALFDDPAQRPNLINMYNVSYGLDRYDVASPTGQVSVDPLLSQEKRGVDPGNMLTMPSNLVILNLGN